MAIYRDEPDGLVGVNYIISESLFSVHRRVAEFW